MCIKDLIEMLHVEMDRNSDDSDQGVRLCWMSLLIGSFQFDLLNTYIRVSACKVPKI